MFVSRFFSFTLQEVEWPGYYHFRLGSTTYSNGTLHLDENGKVRDLWTREPSVAEAICKHSFNELDRPEYIAFYEFKHLNGIPVNLFISAKYDVVFNDEEKKENVPNGGFSVSLYTKPDPTGWNKPFSFLQYAAAFEKACNRFQTECTFSLYNNDDEIKAVLKWDVDGLADRPMDFWLGSFWETFRDAHDDAYEQLTHDTFEGQLVSRFEFPKELQASCGQYLLYFAQFLRDIGVEATTDVSIDASEVLFSVQPEGGEEALAKIRDALGIYLSLPFSPINSSEQTYAIQQLEHQVDSLQFRIRSYQRELRMAERERLMQDSLLFASKAAIERLREGSKSMQSSTEGQEDQPKAMVKLTTVKKLEQYGLGVDLAEIVKRLRAKFGKKGEG